MSVTPSTGVSDERCFRRSFLEVLRRGHAVGEGDGEGVQRWLPSCDPSCLTGALGSMPRVTRYRVLRAACSVGKCPRTVTARRYREFRLSIAFVLNRTRRISTS